MTEFFSAGLGALGFEGSAKAIFDLRVFYLNPLPLLIWSPNAEPRTIFPEKEHEKYLLDMYPKIGDNKKHMKYEVIIKRKILKGLPRLPLWIQKNLVLLIQDLENKGPEQPIWKNYSKLSKVEYHCHLGLSWVACWRYLKPTIIEVYYVGSREKAPY